MNQVEELWFQDNMAALLLMDGKRALEHVSRNHLLRHDEFGC